MIHSPASGHMLDRLRALAGPNPEGSKLTEADRLHLIFLIGAMSNTELPRDVRDWTTHHLLDQLRESGLNSTHIKQIVEGADDSLSAVKIADRIAVHPDLRHPYLD